MKKFALLICLGLLLSLTQAQIRIVKVDPTTSAFTLKNFGSGNVDVSSYRLCALFSYTQNLTSLTVVSGNLDIPAGAEVELSGWNLSAVSDFGLYLGTGSFGDQPAMVDFVQWGSGGNGRESVAVGKGIWTAGDFLSGSGPFVYTGNGTENGLSAWASQVANVRIAGVNPTTDQITIKNYGDAAIDISGYRLCSEFVYTANLTDAPVNIVSGALALNPGDSVIIDGWPITDAAADLGIYLAAGAFGSPAAMVDFVQWGGAGIGRESVAVMKGIWTAGDFITGTAPYFYTGDGSQNGLPFWANSPAPNALGAIRIVYVNPATDVIHIKNFGTSTFDISGYRLCSEFNYTGDLTSAPVTLISGSLNLAPGDTAKLSGWPLTDNAADLGLYRASGAFSDTASMLDFLQWGGAGIGRESVAASKGIWTAGDFITGLAPYSFTGNGSSFGLSFWSVTTGLFADLTNTGIRAYPTPAVSFVRIVMDNTLINSGDIRAKLVDIRGREVRRIDRITEPEFLLERGHLNDGTYFLQVIQHNQTIAIQKIIFQ